MSFSFAQYLLDQPDVCNGHKNCVVSTMSVEDAMEIIKELEELVDNSHSFVIELWNGGGFSIYRKDKWKCGEHSLGHVDQLIMSADNV